MKGFLLLFWLLSACVVPMKSRTFVDDPDSDYDGDGVTENQGDCDDNQALVYAGGEELCDGLDNDCDGVVDDGSAVDAGYWYPDADSDGYGQTDALVRACVKPEAFVSLSGDCDDANPSVHPNAQEQCSGLDDDCDGFVDAEDPDLTVTATWYLDRDGDRYGTLEHSMLACERPNADYVRDANDCDDTNPLIYPDADETCDGLDNDCDGQIDDSDGTVLDPAVWTIDADGDGYGSTNSDAATVTQCSQPVGFALAAIDCDDANPDVHPLADERCNGVDDDCDTVVDEEVQTLFFVDADGDGYGAGSGVLSCGATPGLVANDADCDDGRSDVNPDVDEVCFDGDADGDGVDDLLDNNCDGFADDAGAVDSLTWYRDLDSDGFGDSTHFVLACERPSGHVSDGTDCDDLRGTVNPFVQEDCGTAYDDDCSGSNNDSNAISCVVFYEDGDDDGAGVNNGDCLCEAEGDFSAATNTDCDDTNPLIHPGLIEDCLTTEDDNCDGDINTINADNCVNFFRDVDGDGYGDVLDVECRCSATLDYGVDVGGDCMDTDGTVNPGATEICDGGIDNDCDGMADDVTAVDAVDWFHDGDGDGFGTMVPYVLPDGRNSSVTQCEQPYGFVSDDTDCDDTRNLIHPSAVETCHTLYDDDCDGETNWDVAPSNAVGCTDYHLDVDADGFGDPGDSLCSCAPEGNYTAINGEDCDDTRADTYLGAVELCTDGDDDGDGFDDVVDNDCDGLSDEEDSFGCVEYFLDGDGDGYGVSDGQCSCEPEGEYVTEIGGDCNDNDPLINLEQGCELVGFIENDRASHHVIVPEEFTVAGRFDYNGDGSPDLAMSDSSYDSLYTNPGRVMVWLSPLPAQLNFYDAENADLIIDPQVYNLKFGEKITAGDFDGDGLDELLVDSYSSTNSQSGSYLFDYENTGLGTVTELDATAVFQRTSSNAPFCHNAIGDVNGDGFEDLEYSSNCASASEIMYGGPDLAVDDFLATGLSMGNYVTSNYSSSTGGFWDYNGDGIQDLLYSGYNTNAQVHFGDVNFDDSTDVDSPSCGSLTAALTDFNGDGYGDVAMGDRTANSGGGRIVVMFGNESVPATCNDMPVQFNGVHSAAGMSWPIGAGDLDADDKTDLVASYYLDYAHPGSYCMTLWYGRQSGVYENLDADASFDSVSGLGWPRACGITKNSHSLGDVNGSGTEDLLVVQGSLAGSFNINGYEPYYSGYIFTASP